MKRDHLAETIAYEMEEILELIMNHYKPKDIARAPELLRNYTENLISTIETQLNDWMEEE